MFKVLIDNGVTYLFNDKVNGKINEKTLVGTLINTNGIKEIIESISVFKYYLETEKERKEITKDQAMFIYDEIMKANGEIVDTSIESVLVERVLDFCKKNCDSKMNIPNCTQFSKMVLAISYELVSIEELSNPYDIRVYQTLGLNKNNIANFQNLGNRTVDNYESMLNKYGLSMSKKLDEEIKEKIKRIRMNII